MKKLTNLAVSAVTCAALLTAGAGTAEASGGMKAIPNVIGMKWSKAQTILTSAGFSPAVFSVTGDKEKRSECEVTDVAEDAQDTLPSSDLMVSLNCDQKAVKGT